MTWEEWLQVEKKLAEARESIDRACDLAEAARLQAAEREVLEDATFKKASEGNYDRN